jgi:hypothetical protein
MKVTFCIYLCVLSKEVNSPSVNARKHLRANQKKENPEKLTTYGTQDEDKLNKTSTQYVLDTTMRKQTQIT